jgi:carboxymethylenebutenolidase
MCFDLDSAPPIPPVAGASVDHESLVLEARDGNRLATFAALPEGEGSGIGVVVLPDVRGLYRFYEELALRFAELGHTAIAIDYYGRTAGVSPRDDDFEYMSHREQTTEDGIQADVGAGVAWLRDRGVGAIFTVGFCFGGRASWMSAAGGHGLAGAVGFYGRPPEGIAASIEAPILMLQAGDDGHITQEMNAAFDAELTAAGVPHELVVYDGAPHSFFDRKQDEFAEASADAWRRTLAFLAERG